MKRPTALRPDSWGWSFEGFSGSKIGPMDVENARVVRISQLEHYADHLEKEIERTWFVLESMGVSMERGKTLDNALMVLDQRLRRADQAQPTSDPRVHPDTHLIDSIPGARQMLLDWYELRELKAAKKAAVS